MLMHICCAPIWWPENSVPIWNLLWLSKRLIICTQQTRIYISAFLKALTSKKAKNCEIGIYFSTNVIIALCYAPP